MKPDAVIPTVVLMLKAPVPGRVKTRLAAELGFEGACTVYRRLVERQLAVIPPGWRVEVHFDPPEAGAAMKAWLGSRPEYIPQSTGDLGQRLTHALQTGLPGTRFPLVFLGGDCPYLDGTALESAMCALQNHPVVVGPARDGGYVLIGMQTPQPELFQAIDWSTERVFSQTLQRAREAGLPVGLLPESEDVDDPDSWRRAEAFLKNSS